MEVSEVMGVPPVIINFIDVIFHETNHAESFGYPRLMETPVTSSHRAAHLGLLWLRVLIYSDLHLRGGEG
jgi:hypothetical protein